MSVVQPQRAEGALHHTYHVKIWRPMHVGGMCYIRLQPIKLITDYNQLKPYTITIKLSDLVICCVIDYIQ